MNDDKVNAYQTARELMPLTAGYDHAEAWRFALWLLDAESEAAELAAEELINLWNEGDVVAVTGTRDLPTVLVRTDEDTWRCSEAKCMNWHTDAQIDSDVKDGVVTILALRGKRDLA